MGGDSTKAPYLKSSTNAKIYTGEGKAELFRLIWTDIFQISPEENENFDRMNEERVNEYLQEPP